MKNSAVVAIAAAVFCVSAAEVPAQTPYPSKPVRLIVPVTTGGPSDLVARILSDKLATALGSADLRKRFDDMGLVAKASSPEEFGAFLFSEMGRWKAVLGNKKP